MTWTVIVCEPQREAKLAIAMGDAGYEVFAPTYVSWRGKYAKHTEIRRPLIQGYIFAIMDPHEIHAFHVDGAIRLLPMNWRLSLQLAHKVQDWRELTAAGVFDEPRPNTQAPAQPKGSRNRKARRSAGEAKRTSLDFRQGLERILVEMTTAQPIAA